ncbi:YhgE/Pip domain-containing protein [Alloscardovia omnicolens]|uniref:YhgE/Pip domain-containing protein n=1 Tax=Alloscardovia omnicolens TaxID=419015 RepID=UPI00254D38C3|nr:YhgE/Pip domain-containing protein [Alloscardovia omnicolens]MDK6663315.1 YhgE/Pip domain-containing protein [Alloscardovia omnicolens]MDK7747913.1 YhgE/Pip domain-containing protein [Alloscardovia omnicolens]
MWAILWHDLKKIFTNPVAIIITIGITILPSAYAWLNIISNWDPYANTRHISVAVANLDAGASSQLTGEVNVGEQVVSQLKENDQLGWTFVHTKKEAVEGVESDRYYAAVVIDKNFSRSLVRMITSGGSRPELNYYVNEKLNPIAPKITDSGATALDNLLNAAFIGTASTAVSDQLNISTDKAKSLIEGAHAKTISKLDDLMTTLSETKDGLERARTALDETVDKTHSVQQAVNDTKAAVDSARKAANQAARTASASSTAASGFSNNAAANLASSSASLSLLGVQVGQAGTTISSSLSTANADVATVNARLNTLLAKNDAAVAALSSVLDNSTLDKNSDAYKQLESTLSDLQTLNKQQHDAVNNFSQKAQESLSSAQDSVSNLSSTLSSSALSSASSFQSLSASLNGSLSTSLTGSIDAAGSLASVSAASLGQVSSSLEQSNNVVAQLRSLLQQTSSTIQASENSIEQVCTHINTVRTDFAALDSSALAQRLRDTNLDANAIGSFMQKPVELEQKSVYPVHNYGSAIAPFFTNIALWVGGFVLIAVMKIEVDASSLKAARRARKHKQAKSSFAAAVHTRVRNSEAFMGRWLLFALLGAAQGFVATVGDLIIGIQVEHPVAFVCAGMLASVVYVTVIMALAATLRHIGKALAVILVVMQVPGSSGTYPIEIMPPFFQALEPWLPFTYSINAMRETVAGYYGMEYTKNLGMLSLYLLGAFVLALAIRPYLLNLNALFDRRLAETDLLLSEETRDDGARFRLGSVVQMLMRHDEFARSLRRKAARFGALYPRLVSYGLVAIFAVPLLLLVLLFTVEAKIVFLMLWLLSVVVLDFYLISLEYIREVYERELGMSELSESALRTQVVARVARRWIRDESDEEGDDEQ